MKERPILFSAPMVRAILDGRKTQTRRVLPLPAGFDFITGAYPIGSGWRLEFAELGRQVPCLFGAPGDRLWVRESCALVKSPSDGDWRWATTDEDADAVWYRATDTLHLSMGGVGVSKALDTYALVRPDRWRPSIYMPRWASRITLEITDVRVQRLQDISEEDAAAEGVDPMVVLPGDALSHVAAFGVLWDSINHERAPWDSNPWVWALTFRRVSHD